MLMKFSLIFTTFGKAFQQNNFPFVKGNKIRRNSPALLGKLIYLHVRVCFRNFWLCKSFQECRHEEVEESDYNEFFLSTFHIRISSRLRKVKFHVLPATSTNSNWDSKSFDEWNKTNDASSERKETWESLLWDCGCSHVSGVQQRCSFVYNCSPFCARIFPCFS